MLALKIRQLAKEDYTAHILVLRRQENDTIRQAQFTAKTSRRNDVTYRNDDIEDCSQDEEEEEEEEIPPVRTYRRRRRGEQYDDEVSEHTQSPKPHRVNKGGKGGKSGKGKGKSHRETAGADGLIRAPYFEVGANPHRLCFCGSRFDEHPTKGAWYKLCPEDGRKRRRG